MATEADEEPVPWPQQVLDNVWLLAIAALAFWALSYIVWGLLDLMAIPAG